MGRSIQRIKKEAFGILAKGNEIDIILKDGASFHGVFQKKDTDVLIFKPTGITKKKINITDISEIIICNKA